MTAVPAPGTTQPETGYRAWIATDTGNLVSLYGLGDWPTRGWCTAECHKHTGSTPDADCTCGVYVVRDLDEMLDFIRSDNPARWAELPCVVGQVEFRGPALPSPYRSDPPSTLRVRRARLIRLVALSEPADRLRGVLRRTLGTDVLSDDVQPSSLAGERNEGILALAQRAVGHALDPRRFRINPVRSMAAADAASGILKRMATMQEADEPELRQELLALLSVP